MTTTSFPAAPPLIRIEAANKTFALPDGARFHAVRDVTLFVQAGDIFGLIGKSGAGKSTLLRLFNLLEQPDSGTVTVAGQTLTALGKRALRDARQNIGMIFQQFNLLQNATVFDNVAFPLRIHGGHTEHQVRERVAACLALVELSDKSASYPAQLSGGQKQRVAIARALASKPAVMLCDEPTSALDADTTRALLKTLQDINRRLGVTIVIVSHELTVLGAICNRVAVVEDGAIAEQLTLDGAPAAATTSLGRELLRLRAAETVQEPAHAPAPGSGATVIREAAHV